jgi:hypothetical protein
MDDCHGHRGITQLQARYRTTSRGIDAHHCGGCRVGYPDAGTCDRQGCRTVANRDRLGHGIGARVDPGYRAVQLVRYPDGAEAEGYRSRVSADWDGLEHAVSQRVDPHDGAGARAGRPQ